MLYNPTFPIKMLKMHWRNPHPETATGKKNLLIKLRMLSSVWMWLPQTVEQISLIILCHKPSWGIHWWARWWWACPCAAYIKVVTQGNRKPRGGPGLSCPGLYCQPLPNQGPWTPLTVPQGEGAGPCWRDDIAADLFELFLFTSIFQNVQQCFISLLIIILYMKKFYSCLFLGLSPSNSF